MQRFKYRLLWPLLVFLLGYFVGSLFIKNDSMVVASGSNNDENKQITMSQFIQLNGANKQDTLWIPLNESYFPSNGASFNPPDYAGFNGNWRFFLRRTSGPAADSIAVLLKPCDHHGNIMKAVTAADLDTLWAFGSSFTSYANVGSGSTYTKSLTGAFDPLMQLAAIIKKGDGGNHTFEFGVYKQ